MQIKIHILTFRASSRKTRIETKFTHPLHWDSPAFRASSRKTRIETLLQASDFTPRVFAFRASSRKTRIETTLSTRSGHLPYYLSERHPEKQGLKHVLEDKYCRIEQTFRASSRKTRIETELHGATHTPWNLSERHPEKQGLKPFTGAFHAGSSFLSERHPEKQGLKLEDTQVRLRLKSAFRASSRKTRIETLLPEGGDFLLHLFQSVIQKNKDWNCQYSPSTSRISFFQSVIQKNKDWNSAGSLTIPGGICLSERHPEKQGLKLKKRVLKPCTLPRFQSVIQKNKDWNPPDPAIWNPAESGFQSVIQKNKDWNWSPGPRPCVRSTFRASSRKTRIETPEKGNNRRVRVLFQSVIQKNKDWNISVPCGVKVVFEPFRASSRKTRIETVILPYSLHMANRLSERHPEKQGLKL